MALNKINKDMIEGFYDPSSFLQLSPVSPNDAPNNSIFIDLTDSLLKFKNSEGLVKIITLV